MRKRISIDEISQKSKSPSMIIDDIRESHYSLLRSFGCDQFDNLCFWVRLACRFFIGLAILRSFIYFKMDRMSARKRALGKIFSRGAPFVIDDPEAFPVTLDSGLVIGFNHPSLGEIIRLMAICMIGYGQNRYLFPVNIVWFEALAPITSSLAKFGFELTPVITPSAKNILLEGCQKQGIVGAEALIDRLATGFSGVYAAKSASFIREKQIVLVAPSARRRYHLFPDEETRVGKSPTMPQTMTLIVASLRRKRLNYQILPVAVILPKTKSKGLNLLRKYQFSPCEIMLPDEVEPLCDKREDSCEGRRFERYFLEAIAQKLSSYNASDMLVGPD